MNILFLFKDDNTNGGASSILRQILEYYLSHNSTVHIVFLKDKKYGHLDDLACKNLKLYYGGGLIKFYNNIKSIHNITFDYSFNSVVKFTGLVGLLKRLGILHIRTMVGRESTSVFLRFCGFRLYYYKIWYRLGYKAADVIICQSDIMKKQLVEHLPWIERTARVVVIPNPVNIKMMNERAKEIINISKYNPYIITAGRIIPEKAYDVLLDSFAIISSSYPNLKLVILGDGRLRPQIEKQIETLGLREKVYLMGQVPNVYPWFKNASLCVVSSRLEGFPNVLLQMMSQNVRVVSTLCAGGIERISGLFTCQINDPGALAKAISSCLTSDVQGKRELFDKELKSRSIEGFIRIVENQKTN